jgi:hypothetical protein
MNSNSWILGSVAVIAAIALFRSSARSDTGDLPLPAKPSASPPPTPATPYTRPPELLPPPSPGGVDLAPETTRSILADHAELAGILQRLEVEGYPAAVLSYVYHVASVTRSRHGIDPVVPVVVALLETGYRNFPAQSTRGWNLWGVKGEWGPILSGKTADLFGMPDIRVSRDYSFVATAASDGTSQRWRAYPSLLHGTLDWLRMVSTAGNYTAVPSAGDAAAQLDAIQRGGYHPQRYWTARTWLLLEKAYPGILGPERLSWARANIGSDSDR